MTMRFKAAAALAAGLLLTAATAAAAADAVEGAWKVTHVEITGANPLTVATPQESLYIFAHGHYANVGVQGTAPRTAAPPPADPAKLTDAEKLARYDEWAPIGAQAGSYVLTGAKLTRTPTVAKNVGAVQAGAYDAEVSVKGDTLVITTHAPAGQPARDTKLTLTRVK